MFRIIAIIIYTKKYKDKKIFLILFYQMFRIVAIIIYTKVNLF
jgi:hypothetical protein